MKKHIEAGSTKNTNEPRQTNEISTIGISSVTNSNQLDAIIEKAASNAADGLGEITPELEQKLQNCRVDFCRKYAKNQFLFSVDDTPVITNSDIHVIGAKQKGGKTSLVAILIAAILCGQWNRVKCLKKNAKILYIDTEMKPVDTQALGFKAAKMAEKNKKTLKKHVMMLNFRPLTPEEMEIGVRYFINMYKPTLVVIDGIVDLCSNFNDVEASQNLVINFLMKIAEEYKCAIISVLHTNKTDGYTELRGHLGAFFAQKSASQIRCDKDDKTNIVTVTFPDGRYAPVPEFHFTFNNEGIPVAADDLHKQIKADKQRTKDEEKAAQSEAVYKERSQIIIDILKANGNSMERKELVNEAMKRLDKAISTINNVLKKMLEENTPRIEQIEKSISVVN